MEKNWFGVTGMNSTGLTFVILTFNEQENLPYLLENVRDIATEIVILDSGSSDRTLELACQGNCRIHHRDFDNFSNQRNFALKDIAYNTEWVFVLDADEILTSELKDELKKVLSTNPEEDAFFIKRRFYWMGKWVKRGYYPIWLMRLGRAGKMVCDERGINEHMICPGGKTGKLKYDFIDENHKGISDWLNKHNRYSDYEAVRLLEDEDQDYALWGSQYERKRWIRVKIWNRLPNFTRPFLLLFYRLFIRLGVLDGGRVVLYHFLHAFIYRFIIDAKLVELKRKQRHASEKTPS